MNIEFLKEQRRLQKVSIKELSKRSGVSEKDLGRIERGLQNVTVERLERITGSLGLAVVIVKL